MRLRLALALALLASAGWAQDRAVVVTACGTAPGTFAVGETRPILQNTDGEVCVAGAGGDSGAPTDAPYYVTTADPTLSAEVVPSAAVQGLLDDADATAMRASIGLTIPGSDTQCIFNDGGALGADAGCTFNKTTDALSVVGALTSGNHVLGSSNSLAWSTDLFLVRSAANTLALRNGANAQALHINNSWIDVSNYERLTIRAIANLFEIATEASGTGSSRSLNMGTYGASVVNLFSSSVNRWQVSASGHLLGFQDGQYDIGQPGATRPRSIYAATSVITSILSTGGGALTLTAGAVGLAKMTASASAPGATGGKVELVCGTNAGTAKLVAYAGTSTTAVTILDNIGAGVTGC